MTQLVSIGITINGHVNEVVQLDLVGMLVKYEALGFICEGVINFTQPGDAEDGSLLALDYY